MKKNMRFIVAGLVLALIAALGFSRGAWAGALMEGTVPSCPTSGSGGTFTTCNATATGPGFTITDVEMPSLGGNPIVVPGSLNDGPAVDLETGGSLTILCFPDIDTPPVGNIWAWMEGKWVYWATYHTTNGMTCTYTPTSGVYTIEY